ncbi:MAG: DUF4422 domain-containing protein, partial [Psittacicella sp.]
MNTIIYNASKAIYQNALNAIPFIKSIQLGSAINPFEYGFELQDNVSDNISLYFDYYGVFTGIYWILKNDINSKFIGFMTDSQKIYFGDLSQVSLNNLSNICFLNTDTFYDYKNIVFPEYTT